MLRVTGGEFGGRRIQSPPGDVRPTQDKVRQALFSILGERIIDCTFLDLYAGSGAVGIDALSRGARFVCWVERARGVLAALKNNIAPFCGPGRGRIIAGDVMTVLGRPMAEGPFDIVFADPPYDLSSPRDGAPGREASRGEARGLVPKLLGCLDRGGWVAAGGCVVVEVEEGARPGVAEGWEAVDDRRYGKTRLVFFRKAGADPAGMSS